MSIMSQVRDLFSRNGALERDQSGVAANVDLQIATVAILLEAACGDEEFHRRERDVVLQGIERELGIGRQDARRLLDFANEDRLKKGGIESSLALVKEGYSDEQVATILGLVKRVIEADDVIHPIESVLYDHIRKELGFADG